MDYKQKLIDWNNTDKYKVELSFLERLIQPRIYTSILDYGCGIGTAMDKFCCSGYDVNDFYIGKNTNDYYNHLPDIDFCDIYFMHSIAHINNIEETLIILKNKYGDRWKGKSRLRVTVITPNAEWLDEGYNNDSSVIKHYSQPELCKLFIDSGYTVQLVGQFGEYKNKTNERIFLQVIV